MSLGLYIHIPFCRSRCPYCDFAFVVRQTHLAKRYTNAVVHELQTQINAFDTNTTFDTLYFGGGTPSHMPPQYIEQILNAVQKHASLSSNAEITVEANPGDQSHFSTLKKTGVNRLSLGIQALTDRALKALGRFHNTEDALDAFKAARATGFTNIGIDLIFGAPKQTQEEWTTILKEAVTLNAEHISVYGLTIEPDTNFDKRAKKQQLPLPTETLQSNMFLRTIDHLTAAHYEHYEISNFAQPNFASQHNQSYWEGKPYLGVGLSAHSFINNKRIWNVTDLQTYMQSVENTGLAVASSETIDANKHLLEKIMLGIRRKKGLDIDFLEQHTPTQLQHLLNHNLLENHQNRIRLTRKGLLIADAVCTELVKDL
ncbi:MAG: radical SAM family heme chaperone HemW [Candidatus Latescibacteria bacterium]|nr:radical SAM family heme chaperone HemW [Candidatus Latescibacterota bacterium]